MLGPQYENNAIGALESKQLAQPFIINEVDISVVYL